MAQAYIVLARIQDPQPNECQGIMQWWNFASGSGSNSLLISDAANPNGRTPVVGDCFTSHAFTHTCTAPLSWTNTVWVVEQLVQASNVNVTVMPSAVCPVQAYNYTTRICNPQPNECQGVITASASLIISDAANPNGRSPVVGDCYISPAAGVGCSGTSSLGYNTVWVVESLIQPSSSGVAVRQSAQCCQTWDCKTDKFGNTECVDPGNGNGTYDSLQDCQNNCDSRLVFEDFDRTIGDLYPTGPSTSTPDVCKETLSCPCGWTPYQSPNSTWGWGCETTVGTAGAVMTPYRVPCHHIDGANPIVGDKFLLDQWVLQGNSTSQTIGGTIVNWDSAFVFSVKSPSLNPGSTMQHVQQHMANHTPPPGNHYVNSPLTSNSCAVHIPSSLRNRLNTQEETLYPLISIGTVQDRNIPVPRRTTIQDEYDLIKVTSFYSEDENQKVSIIPTAEINTPKVVSDLLNPESVLPPPSPVCLMDIVIAVDLSGSTQGPGFHPYLASSSSYNPNHPDKFSWYGRYDSNGNPRPYEAQRILLEGLIDYLSPGMIAGEIQVGVVMYGSNAQKIGSGPGPDGFSMSSSVMGDLSTAKIIPETPHPLASQINNDPLIGPYVPSQTVGSMHSKISRWMHELYGAYTGGGTNITRGMKEAQMMLNNKIASDLGDRSSDPDFKQVIIVLTDSSNTPQWSGWQYCCDSLLTNMNPPCPQYQWPSLSADSCWPCNDFYDSTGSFIGCFGHMINPTTIDLNNGELSLGCKYQSSSFAANPYNPTGPIKQKVIGVVCQSGSFSSPSLNQQNIKDTLDAITCNNNAGSNPWNTSAIGEQLGFYVNILDPNEITDLGAAIVSASCGWPDPSFECSGPTGSGIYPAWTCYDPGTGQGSNTNITDCYNFGYQGGPCADPNPNTYDCKMNKSGIGTCVGVSGGGGQYSSLAQCLLNCHVHQALPGLDVPDTWKCTIPLGSINGYCTKGQWNPPGEPTEQACLDGCIDHQLFPDFPITEGYNCELNTTGNYHCVGPVYGGSYPTLSACQAVCGTLATGTANPWDCYVTRSCPCGWQPFYDTGGGISCDSTPLTGTNTSMTIPAIERTCMQIENLATAPLHDIPVQGDVWEHTSPSTIPASFAWTEVYVVDSIQGVSGVPNLETRSSISCQQYSL